MLAFAASLTTQPPDRQLSFATPCTSYASPLTSYSRRASTNVAHSPYRSARWLRKPTSRTASFSP